MNPKIRCDVTVTHAYHHQEDDCDDVQVAFTSPQPTVPAMSRSLATMKEMGIDPTKVVVDDALRNHTLSITAEQYVEQYKRISDYESLNQLREKTIAEEHVLRQMFAKKFALQDNPLVTEKHPLLVPVFGNEDIFGCRALYPEEKKVPKVFPLGKKRKEAGVQSIVSKDGFNTNWRIFSERLLDLVDWKNVFIAGGAVMACLLPPPPKATKNFKCLRKYFHEDVYAGSDIDLFIYGLNEEEGKKKLEEIYEAVCNEIPYAVLAFRSAYAISIVSQFPYRHIQIILRLYSSPAEILMGFDVDSCSVGFDGTQVYMTPRCHQALVRQMNTIDVTRRSPTYEMRLAKYADRGFEVEVPTLLRDRIDPMIFEKPWDDVRGLAKLLLLEKLRTPEARYAYKERSTNQRTEASWKMERYMQDPYLKKRLEYSNEKASDYSTVFLPWGPQWTAKRIRKLMMTKDIVLNSDWSEQFTNRGYHTHPCFIGTLEDVEKDCCGHCPDIPKDVDPEKLECFVRGALSFIVDDPGRQSIGSFHPITDGDWSDGAYLSKESEQMVLAANSGDVALLREFVQNGVLVDTPDALGRTALHIAVLSNQLETVRALLEMGANPMLHLKDGRNVVHIAAQYGYLDMLALLLDALRMSRNEQSGEGEVKTDSLDLDEPNPTTHLTALHYAVLFGHVDCVEFLLKNGATCDKMIWNTDKTAAVSVMVLAAHTECFNTQVTIDLYKLLHDHGASLKLMDNAFNNVMHMLCSFNYVHFVQYLVENDPIALSLCDELNGSGQTAAMVALSNGYYTIARMLVEHGALIEASPEQLKILNNRRKRDTKANRWGFHEVVMDNLASPYSVILSAPKTDASLEFIRFLVEKEVDVNRAVGNTTPLDILLNQHFYLTEEEFQQNANLQWKMQAMQREQAQKLLKQYTPDSYEYDAIKAYCLQIEQQSNGQQRETMWTKHQRKENNAWMKKVYTLLDEKGALTWREMVELNVDKPKTGGRGRRGHVISSFGTYSGFGGFSNPASSDRCVTVVDGKALHGEKRLAALKKEYLANIQASGMVNTNQTVTGLHEFTIYADASNYGWRNNAKASGADAQAYIDLFTAVKKGDCAKVRSLCTPDANGTCCHVLCSGYNNLSPLALAISQGNQEMIRLLFELAILQYTPIPVVRKDPKESRVSNYALITGENTSDEESGFVDPNADASMIVNTCDVNVLFTELCGFDMKDCPSFSSLVNPHGNMYGSGFNGLVYSSMGNPLLVEDDEDDNAEGKKEEKPRMKYCSIFEYLVYRGDVALLTFCLERLAELSDAILQKDLEANRVKPEDKLDHCLLHSLFSTDISFYSHNKTSCNVYLPILMNDNLDMLRVLIQFNMGGLEVLREVDVKEEKKTKKHRLGSNGGNSRYMMEEFSDEEMDLSDCCSCDDDEEEDIMMDTENQEEVDMEVEDEELKRKEESEEEDEEKSEESEYADSDEEEMRAMRAFREEGKKTEEVKRNNTYYPILVAVRYNATRCLRYFMDAKRVQEDLKTLLVKCPLLAPSIQEAGGIEQVYDRVFTLKHHKKDARLLLQLATANNNLQIFQQLLKELEEEQFDLKQLVHASKQYPSLLEYSINTQCFAMAAYLLQTFSFREYELCSAYQLLAGKLHEINASYYRSTLSLMPGRQIRRTPIRAKKMAMAVNPVELYSTIIALVDLIPVGNKPKILEIFIRTLLTTPRPAILQEVLEHVPGGATELSDYDQIVAQVIQSHNDDAMQILIDCLGLRARLMHEDSRGRTVVDSVMDEFVGKTTLNQNIRPVRRDDAEEVEKIEEQERVMFGDTEEKKQLVALEKKYLPGKNSLVRMLKLVLEGANGQPRVLTTPEAVQKRVKRESKKAAESTFRGRRRCIQRGMQDSDYTYKTNTRMQTMANLTDPLVDEKKE